MAFFGSKSIERDLRRSYSTDRIRRERTTSAPTSHTQPHKIYRVKAPAMPSADEFGVVSSGNSSGKDDPPSLTFSTTSVSPSLPSDPITPVASPSLSVPPVSVVNGTRSSLSSPASSMHKQPSSRTRTVSSSGSKHSSNSHSSNPSRRRTPQLEVDDPPSSDAVARTRRPSYGSSGSKKVDAVTRTHSSSEPKVERTVAKSRSKTSIHAQVINDGAVPVTVAVEPASSETIPARPPRNARPHDMQQPSSSKPSSPSSTTGVASPTQEYSDPVKHSDAHVARSTSSSSASPLSGPSNTGLPLKQLTSQPSPSVPTMSSATLRRENPALSVPANQRKSSCGNASDSSYGAPFTEFGVGGFSVKRLLSKPAASSVLGTTGVRSEPDTSTASYDSYGAYALGARRRRVEGRSNTTDTPSSLYSLTGGSLSASSRDHHSRKPTTSDPEPPRSAVGSLGRSKGLEWGHVLNRERERERESERGKAHAREGSSYSLSSPSEGAPGYPYGLAYERIQDRRASKNPRPVVQLTTNAVKRLSAFGVREADRGYDRDRSHSPGTPMTFGPTPSPTPSPLTAASASASSARTGPGTGPGTRNGGGGRTSTQPSPTTASSSIVRRPESPKPPVGLTPAEIVAHQYKQQERRRAELEREVARQAEVPERIHTSMHSRDFSELDYERSQRTVRVKSKDKDKEKDRHSLVFQRTSANALPSPISETSNSSNKSETNRKGESPTPYYTVFGEQTGRIVAIGSARDSAFGLFDRAVETRAKETEQAVVAELSGNATSGIAVTTTTTTTTTTIGFSDPPETSSTVEKPVKSQTLRRKLSRKMSGKSKADGNFSRGGSGKESGKDSSDGRDDKLELGDILGGGSTFSDDWYNYGSEGILRTRPSLTLNTTTTMSGRRSATLPRDKNGTVSVKMSMDSYVAVQSIESTSGRTLPSAANGSLPGILGKTRLKDEKEKEKEKGKLWGLVKRISSNTLKDKYNKRCSLETVPPVPTLPRDVSSSSSHTSPTLEDDRWRTDGASVRDGDAYAIHLGTPPSSGPPSRRPSTAPTINLAESPREGRFATLRKKPSIAQMLPQGSFFGTSPTQVSRPSATTRSSSPMSSDLVFSYKQSDVSSLTSYGELPSTSSNLSRGHPVLGEHILPPETLSMFDELNLNNLSFNLRKEDGTGSKPESRAIAGEEYDTLFYSEEPMSHRALPAPPRRPLTKADADADIDEFRSESPTIPSFSSGNAINAFGNRKRAPGEVPGEDFRTTSKSSPPASSSSPASSVMGGAPEPPPRPPRSTMRIPPGSSSIVQPSYSSPHATSTTSPSLARAVFEDHAGRTSIGGHSQASTARPSPSSSSGSNLHPTPTNPSIHRPSTSSPCSTPSPPPDLLDSHQSPVSASDSASSTMTFRDMSYVGGVGGARTRPALTEKEKADKWNDLLDRSERAGGTLHVGVGGALLSDTLRESSYEPTIRDSLYDY